MTEEVVDSSVFVSNFVKDNHYEKAKSLIEDLRLGNCLFHISMLVPIEVCAAILRQTGSLIEAYAVKRNLELWVKEGKIKLYELNEQRMNKAAEIAIRDGLKGADATIAEISEELGIPLRTFDKEILERFKGIKVL